MYTNLMRLIQDIQNCTFKAVENGHSGLFTINNLLRMLNGVDLKYLTKVLSKAEKDGTMIRVCRGVYLNPFARPKTRYILEAIAVKLKPQYLVYVSLESQLVMIGKISQQMQGYLTVMTNGRSGKIETIYGTVEFTHTKADINKISEQLYFDNDAGIFRAKENKAMADLKRAGRNLHMLD